MKTTVKQLLLISLCILLTSCGTEEITTQTEPTPDVSEAAPKDEESAPTPDTNEDLPSVAGSVVEANGLLQVDGRFITNKAGEPIQLRGMSFFWSQWSEGAVYYNADVVKWLVEDWKVTIVRAAMGVDESLGYLTNPEVEKAKVFAVIDAAIAEGIYVIVDWHSHHAEDYTTEAKAFFKEVAEKYGQHPNIIYEIYNEPLDVSWANVLKPYHEAIISEIRKVDPDNLVICGTRNWGQEVSDVIGNPVNDVNVAYTLHYYASTHIKDSHVWQEAQKAIEANIPLFVTEFGITEYTGNGVIDTQKAENWWRFLDEHKISWCNWSIANKNESAAVLNAGASATGGWSLNDLKVSGKIVREELLKKN